MVSKSDMIVNEFRMSYEKLNQSKKYNKKKVLISKRYIILIFSIHFLVIKITNIKGC